MFKKKNVDESTYHEERLRFVTTEFSGLGINGHVNDMFLIAANVPAPPCLLLNTEHYDGPAPFNAIPYDAGGTRVVCASEHAKGRAEACDHDDADGGRGVRGARVEQVGP